MSSSSSHPWTLEVEGFGPIIEAKIESAPLTLLVGDNNSGKSYLAILLWSVYQLGNNKTQTIPNEEDPTYRSYVSFFEKIGKDPYLLTDHDLQKMIEWCSELVMDSNISRIFNLPGLSAKKIALVAAVPSNHRDFLLQRDSSSDEPGSVLLKIVASPGSSRIASRFPGLVTIWMLRSIVGRLINLVDQANVPTYLPASRTGFMLLYGPASAYAVERFYGSEEQEAPRVKLPVPALEFLEWLGRGPDAEPGPFAGEADILEGLLGGAIEVERRPVGAPTYQYRPAGGESLPMPQVSSLVSELAPIILVLRYAKKLSFLVIEEPEAHLHPKVQRVLARTIVRLVRKGVRIILTTHSDLFCQQINNCLKLGSLSEAERSLVQKQLGYDPSEYLTAEDVRGYSFQNTPKGSVVTPLQNGPFGLDMPTFNQELENILDESRRIEDRMSQSTGGAE